MAIKIVDGHMHITQWISADGKTAFDRIKDYQEKKRNGYAKN